MLTTLSLAALLLLAQDDPARSRLRGTVRTADGEPWTGVRVMLVSGFPEAVFGRIEPEVLEVRSDGRGRFEAMVLPGRAYSVWAVAGGKGRFRCSDVVERAHAGGIARLRESWRGYRQVAVALTDRARWRDREPLRFQVVTATQNQLVLDVEPDAGGSLPLPPLPGGECTWQVLGKDGSVVMASTISLRSPEDGKGDPPANGVGPRRIELAMPERFPWLLKVVTRSGKKPVAGVSVLQRIWHSTRSTRWMLAGTTDEKGLADLQLTRLQGVTAAGQQHVLLRVQGEGCALQQFGRSVAFEKDRDLSALRKEDKPDYTMQVYGETAAVRGRVLISEGRPAPRRQLLFFPSYGNPKSRSFYFNVEPVLVETDDEGRFATGGWGPRFAYRICLLADAEIAAALPRSPTHPTAPVLMLAVGVTEGDVDLGDLVLDELHAVDLSARRKDGFPAAGSDVLLAEAGSSIKLQGAAGRVESIQLHCYKALTASLGRRGRLRLFVPDTDLLHLGVILDGAWALRKLVPGSGAPVALTLSEPALLSGRVVNGSGKPVPGAMVQANPMRYPKGFNSRLANLFTQRFVTTDAEGRFRIGLPFKETSYHFWARIQVDGRWYNTQHQNILDVEGEGRVQESLELEVPIPDAALPGAKKARGSKK